MSLSHRRVPLVGVAAALGLFVAGCAGAQFEPAPSANAVPAVGENAARASQSGVTVTTLSPGEWPGPYAITDEVTPMKVRIQNDSGAPIAIRYGHFMLTSPGAGQWRALPLYRIDGEAERAVTVRDYTPFASPGFGYSGFEVAPYYSPVYPTISPFRGPFATDSYTWDLYDTYYIDRPLPTLEMRQRALPEGVLRPGGYVDGYVFFAEVPEDAGRVVFNFDLVNVETGQRMGQIQIPYLVT